MVASASPGLACGASASACAAAARVARIVSYPFAAEYSAGADQGEVDECLREVADLPAAGDVEP
jgi:hypothetical protein